jgi:molybdopterin-containing oxidoreductase family iron-sulfur binding subunit
MKKQPTDKLDTTLRHEDLPARQGKDYWRSLEELADTPEFRKRLAEEFPQLDSFWDMPVDRRSLLKLMGASLALAGITGCERQPKEEIVPYVRMPEQIVPGQPLYFATALTRGGYAQGVLVESHLGRPTKVEGNELHPASLGATDIFSQAGVLSLYDPDRSQLITEQGNTRGWTRFVTPVVA